MPARMAFPALAVDGNWKIQEKACIGNLFVQLIKGNIHRTALGAPRLRVLSQSFHIEFLRNILLQQFPRRLRVLFANHQLDSAN